MKKRAKLAALAGLSLLLAGATTRHLELVGSYPKQDQTVASAPVDISLVFSESASPDSSSIRLEGPQGDVRLGPIRAQDEGLVLMAKVEGPMPAGSYTVEWLASAPDVEPASGRIRFTVRQGR